MLVKEMTGVDIADYLERLFPELKSRVSSDSDGIGHIIRSDYAISFHVGWGSNEEELRYLMLKAIYQAIGTLTVLAESYRDRDLG